MQGDEDPVGALFGRPPEEFTAARDRLAREMRERGERDAAAAVKALRRPTVAAWALNQVSRQHAGEIAALVEAGNALRRAQRRLMSGLGAAPMRDAQARRREIVGRLGERVAEVLREHGASPDAHAAAIRTALEAASVDAEAAARLREGRLSQPPEAVTGFEAAAGLALVPDAEAEAEQAVEGETAAGAEAGAEARERLRAEIAQAEERLAAAGRASEEAATRARGLERETDRATDAAAEAEAEVARLSRRLEAARDLARRASERAERASAAAHEAAEAADQRERERREAAADLDRLRRPDPDGLLG